MIEIIIFGIIVSCYIVVVSAGTPYCTTLLGSLVLLLELGWPGHSVFIHSGQEVGTTNLTAKRLSVKLYPSRCPHDRRRHCRGSAFDFAFQTSRQQKCPRWAGLRHKEDNDATSQRRRPRTWTPLEEERPWPEEGTPGRCYGWGPSSVSGTSSPSSTASR